MQFLTIEFSSTSLSDRPEHNADITKLFKELEAKDEYEKADAETRARIDKERPKSGVMLDRSRQRSGTTRRQFSEGGQWFFRLLAEGDTWCELFVHEASFHASEAAVADKFGEIEKEFDRLNNAQRYLIQASYNSAAAAAFVSNPQDRVKGVESLAKQLGGKLESFDFCLGEYDVIGVVALADDTTAAAFSLAVNAPGHLRGYRTTRLLSAKEFLDAQKKAQGVSYKGPKA